MALSRPLLNHLHNTVHLLLRRPDHKLLNQLQIDAVIVLELSSIINIFMATVDSIASAFTCTTIAFTLRDGSFTRRVTRASSTVSLYACSTASLMFAQVQRVPSLFTCSTSSANSFAHECSISSTCATRVSDNGRKKYGFKGETVAYALAPSLEGKVNIGSQLHLQ